jgi:hypothetical protein|tara:strand:+ start:1044 stop:1328 length:285 start_codon:yes stop_codon:yes gene_type:complete
MQKAISIKKEDIFNFIVGTSGFDPIEKCIDPKRYEVYDEFIYDHKTGRAIEQNESFCDFSSEANELRQHYKELPLDVQFFTDKLHQSAPKEITL